MNQRNANRLKQKGTASLTAWDFKSRDTPKEVPEPQKESMSAFANVPRRTEIMGQPHMLSYINPEEEAVLQQMRGGMPPVAGPDGVPSYFIFGGRTGFGSWGDSIADSFSGDGGGGGRDFDADMSVGAINTGGTYSGDDPVVSGGFDFDDDDDDNNISKHWSTDYDSSSER